jgi:hypothetical protein
MHVKKIVKTVSGFKRGYKNHRELEARWRDGAQHEYDTPRDVPAGVLGVHHKLNKNYSAAYTVDNFSYFLFTLKTRSYETEYCSVLRECGNRWDRHHFSGSGSEPGFRPAEPDPRPYQAIDIKIIKIRTILQAYTVKWSKSFVNVYTSNFLICFTWHIFRIVSGFVAGSE